MLQNLFNLTLDQTLLPERAAPGHSRLNRSASFFSLPSSSDSSESCSLSVSSEHVNFNDMGGALWSSNIWSQGPVAEPRAAPFRADRSMSLTESTSSLLSAFPQLKNLDAFPSTATSVPPPPGFPPSSNLPAQLQPMASPNRYKTELCRGFQETGSCKYGSKCQFAHGEAELRGLYRHPKYKTEPCRTFYNFGYCPYGSRCHFIHEDKLSGGPLSSDAKFPGHQQQAAAPPTMRHQLRQSVSFAGFLGSSRRSPPPPVSFDLNLGFSRAPSVSPPPAELLSPVFSDALQRDASTFQFGSQQSRASTGEIHNIPLILEPKSSSSTSSSSCCVCGHGNNFNGNNIRAFVGKEEEAKMDNQLLAGTRGHRGFSRSAGLQRSSSEDSLEDSYSSSGGSSGSESPTFDGSSNKRLMVFERLSLSD